MGIFPTVHYMAGTRKEDRLSRDEHILVTPATQEVHPGRRTHPRSLPLSDGIDSESDQYQTG